MILPLIPSLPVRHVPCPLCPNFLSGVRGWRPKRKPCSDVLGRHCLQKMALESFLHVGGIWHFSLSAFHGGTQAWPVSGIPLVAACPSSGAPSVVAPAPWVLLSLLWGGGLLAGHRQTPLAFAGPRAHWCKISGKASRGKPPARSCSDLGRVGRSREWSHLYEEQIVSQAHRFERRKFAVVASS